MLFWFLFSILSILLIIILKPPYIEKVWHWHDEKTLCNDLKGLIVKNDIKKHSIINKLLIGVNEISCKISSLTKARLMIKYGWYLWFVGGDYQWWFRISTLMVSYCLYRQQSAYCHWQVWLEELKLNAIVKIDFPLPQYIYDAALEILKPRKLCK